MLTEIGKRMREVFVQAKTREEDRCPKVRCTLYEESAMEYCPTCGNVANCKLVNTTASVDCTGCEKADYCER
jgi:hypothetical protein